MNKSWGQHPTKQLYGHLPLISKTIQVRRTRHAGHCWGSWDELISGILIWTPTYGREKSRTASSNIHTAAMWGYGMKPWRPARGDEWLGKVAREGQVYPCWRHDMMMMMMMIYNETAVGNLWVPFSSDKKINKTRTSTYKTEVLATNHVYIRQCPKIHFKHNATCKLDNSSLNNLCSSHYNPFFFFQITVYRLRVDLFLWNMNEGNLSMKTDQYNQ